MSRTTASPITTRIDSMMTKTYRRRPRTFLGIPLWRLLNLYPPYLGAGIRVSRSDRDGPEYRVRMKLRRWNRNAVGTHFGGSLSSMVDPFHMLILLEALGPEYIVWDKRSTIRFRKPGRGTVEAKIWVEDEQIQEIRRSADSRDKAEPIFQIEIKDEAGEVVAQIEKTLHIRRKPKG